MSTIVTRGWSVDTYRQWAAVRTQRLLMSVPPQKVISKKLTLTCHGHENGIVSKPPMTFRLPPPGGRGGIFGTSGPGGGRRPPLPAPLSPLVPGTNGSMRGTPHGSELAGKKTGCGVGIQTTWTL